MAHAALLGGMSYGTESAGAAHAMSQSAGGVHDCPHGALTAPRARTGLRVQRRRRARALRADRPGARRRHAGLEPRAALAGVEALHRLTDDVGIPTMEELGSPRTRSRCSRGSRTRTRRRSATPRGRRRRLRGDLPERVREGEALSTATTDYGMVVAGEWVESESGARGSRRRARRPARRSAASPGARARTRGARSRRRTPPGATGPRARRSSARGAGARGRADRRAPRRARADADARPGQAAAREAYGEVDELVEYWRMAAADATRLDGSMPPSVDASKRVLAYRVPRGVVGVITPWNWPYTMPAELIAPALAAGNAVVWTPASTTSVCSVKLAECVVDAELPAGVFNMVTGPGSAVGDEIAGSGTHAVAFIGSTSTGEQVAARAAGKAPLLELGGNGPMVVLDDADVARGRRGEHRRGVPLRRPELHRGRALPRPRGRARRVRRAAARRRSPARCGSAIRSTRRRRWARSTTSATAAKMDEHVADAVERGATLVAGGARAGASRRSSTGSRPCSTA